MSRLKSLTKPANAIALYAFLADTAARQGTPTVYATDKFIGTGLAWSLAKVTRTKQQLRDLDLLEVIPAKHRTDGTFTKTFLRIRHCDICRAVSAVSSPVTQNTGPGEMRDKMLDDRNRNAGREKRESALPTCVPFSIPTADELWAYAAEIGCDSTEAPDIFYTLNERAGWNRLRDWRAAFRGWWEKWENQYPPRYRPHRASQKGKT